MEDLKALAMKGYDALNRHDLDAFDELISPNFVEHEELTNGGTDWDSVKKEFQLFFEAFPDMKVEIDDIATEKDKVWIRGRFTGTHSGPLMGMPATGKRMDAPIMDCLRFENGKCIEHWGVTDNLAMMKQLGMIPEDMPV